MFLTVELVHGENIVVANVEVLHDFAALVIGEHDRVLVGAVRQAQSVADLVHLKKKNIRAQTGKRVTAKNSDSLRR